MCTAQLLTNFLKTTQQIKQINEKQNNYFFYLTILKELYCDPPNFFKSLCKKESMGTILVNRFWCHCQFFILSILQQYLIYLWLCFQWKKNTEKAFSFAFLILLKSVKYYTFYSNQLLLSGIFALVLSFIFYSSLTINSGIFILWK